MGDTPEIGGIPGKHRTQPGWTGKCEVQLEGPTSIDPGSDPDDVEDNKNTAFTWEVRANNWDFHTKSKEKFLCWRRKKYKSNVIHTAKYNFFSFLPLNLYEQFHRVSNLYFLLIIILQGIPEISTLPWFTLFAPLVCLLLIRATRDLVDDIGRHRSDHAVNNRPCQILSGKSFTWRKWKHIRVGDMVCLRKDSIVPADLLLLASTEPSSLCYVETADIDGETNLKFRQALTVTHQELTSATKMASFQGTVRCEDPNSRMHHFVGSLEWNNRKYPLDTGNLLLRGCKIRNTDACYGLVIYAGVDTKIMQNCGKIHLKRTKLELLMNKLVVLIFLSLVAISLALTLGFRCMIKDFKWKHHYVSAKHPRPEILESFLIFWSFLILLSTAVPMSLFILTEFIYLGHSLFINWDAGMYSEPRAMPAKARSTSLNDQLGQVQYVFSDKTGTLTQNILTFKKCCINGHIYDPDEEAGPPCEEKPYMWNEFADGKLLYYNKQLLHTVQRRQDRMVQEFWRLLAICHTVMAQEEDDQLLYQAASPDEEVLVTAARNLGYVFRSRTQDTITVLELGEERVYRVLAMMDFTSDRKRMSVLVRNPEGSICLYSKGADTVILERLHQRGDMEETTEEVLAAFAGQTLRTLCLAYKEVSEEDFEVWESQHRRACLLLQNRAPALYQLYDEMEQNLQLLGATAIEDKLQDGVPEAIQCLKKANMKIWMLTGDKQETAVNIGFACQLLTENMLILEDQEISRILETYWESNNNLQAPPRRNLKSLPQINMAMVITGDFLDQLLLSLHREPQAPVQNVVMDKTRQEPGQRRRRDFLQTRRLSWMWQNSRPPRAPAQSKASNTQESPRVRQEQAFVDLACRCQVVICCRVTPKQKAQIVALVKKYQQAVTLAIGDGANDVNMIKTADIGVGLAGQEGMQAVQNSDYVLAQFCFLKQLLLVHGRLSYVRISKFLRFFFYKTTACVMGHVWFSFYNGFTAQPLYEGWFLALFNTVYTVLLVLYIGLFEQDASVEKSLEMPRLYVVGQREELFNYWIFFQAIAHGMATSLINFFVTLWSSQDRAEPASLGDYQSFAVTVAVSCLLSVIMEAILVIRYWNILCVVAVFLSLGFYAIVTFFTQSLWLYKISPSTFPFLYADYSVLTQPFSLLVIPLNMATTTLPILAFRTICQHLRELHPKVKQGREETPKDDVFTVERMLHLRRESPTRRSSYAFSHREGYADLITRGTILRKPPTVHRGPPIPSDAELPSSPQLSPKNARKTSSLGKKIHRYQGKGTSMPSSVRSLSLIVGRRSTVPSETQPTVTKRWSTTMSRLSRSFQDKTLSSSKDQSQLFATPAIAFLPDLCRSETLERSLSFCTLAGELEKYLAKGSQPPKEDTETLPKMTHTSPAETQTPNGR
ncbi:phospholipid-transporting ATPase IK [Perognathus longimembris pacificus]|uniref:phospholipid-transporting ATPase IK n=1 Tax=Perognathus longimembris pacificus TaxID=214514 RepID=UPI0020191F17|nr:phospholipid-transporting ATPase IK [Perognathus longimembris pacificus]